MQIGKEMAIPSILKIGNGALGKIGGYLKAENLDQVVLFFGNGLIDMFGELVMNSLKEAEVNVLEYNELDTVDIDDIITLAFAIPNKAKAVISIGGGKVIDAGKYAAFLRNLPFISVPTSSSSDGFSETGIWYHRGYAGDPYRSGEVHLLRHRRYDLQDHSALRLDL